MGYVISEDMTYSQNHDLFEKEKADARKAMIDKISERMNHDAQKLEKLQTMLSMHPEEIVSVTPSGLHFTNVNATHKAVNSTDNFIKADSGKNMLSLIEPQFIVDLGKVLTFGAQKYAPNNWQKCEDTSRYKDALLRHVFAYLGGEEIDPETGIQHLSHATCNLMFLHYFENKKG